MTEYQIEISATGSYHVTISTAASEEHAKHLAENPNWWNETTFLDDEVV